MRKTLFPFCKNEIEFEIAFIPSPFFKSFCGPWKIKRANHLLYSQWQNIAEECVIDLKYTYNIFLAKDLIAYFFVPEIGSTSISTQKKTIETFH